jgi:hypothetical protein
MTLGEPRRPGPRGPQSAAGPVPSPQRVRSSTADSRDQPTPANDNQRCVWAAQRRFRGPDLRGRFRWHEFEMYFDC